MRMSDWSSDVCSSDLVLAHHAAQLAGQFVEAGFLCGVLEFQRRGVRGNLGRRVVDRRQAESEHQHACNGHRADGADHLPSSSRSSTGTSSSAMIASSSAPTCFQRTMPSRSDEHTSELQSLMRISYAVFCLKKKKQ